MKVLVVQTGFLGDVILSTPVLTNLKRIFPAAEISVMTTPEARTLVQYHPAVSQVIVFDKRGADRGFSGMLRLAEKLREENFSIVLSLHKSARTSVLLKLARIPERYGFREAALAFLYTKTVRRKHLAHEAERNLVILQALGAKLSELDPRLSLGLPAEAHQDAEEALGSFQSGRIIGIAPGSVWATKRWTASGFAAVADELIEMGYRIVLLGGPKDKDMGDDVERLMAGAPLNLIGKASLLSSAAVIARLTLLVTNDSAPLHIASAMGTPVVAVFCATIPEFGFGPWLVPSETVGVLGLTCRPCGRHGGENCPTGTHACQLKLKPELTMDAVERVLKKNAAQFAVQHA